MQALHGPIDSAGSFIETPATVTLRAHGHRHLRGHIPRLAKPVRTESRCVPFHVTADLISPMELGLVAWAT